MNFNDEAKSSKYSWKKAETNIGGVGQKIFMLASFEGLLKFLPKQNETKMYHIAYKCPSQRPQYVLCLKTTVEVRYTSTTFLV